MQDSPTPAPRWYGIPIRVLLITFIGTLLVFAISLLLAIVGTVIASAVRGIHPDMRVAYRLIALPIAGFAGLMIFIGSVVMEVRHYRKARDFSAD
jgi:uncharacterized BrkB/YihY/UPF0761 family membrane protein